MNIENSYDPTKPYKARILELIKGTWDTPLVEVKDIGAGYPIITRRSKLPDVDHTDGIGTKGIHHWRKRSFDRAVQDALAMNLNDLVTMGVRAYKLQNHLIICQDDHEAIEQIVEFLCKECKSRKIAVTGGETSIQSNIVGMDLSLTVSGYYVPWKSEFRAGNVLVGIESSGLHSNGLTLASSHLPDNWLQILTCPTVIYYDQVHEMIDSGLEIHGMLHIAGGAWTRLLDKLPTGTEAHIDLGKDYDSVFHTLSKTIHDDQMYKTFNCGIGFVMATDDDVAHDMLNHYDNLRIIGKIYSGANRVIINSSFRNLEVVY